MLGCNVSTYFCFGENPLVSVEQRELEENVVTFRYYLLLSNYEWGSRIYFHEDDINITSHFDQ